MNKNNLPYVPNSKHWQRGNIVIHESDAKEPYMLMVVLGYEELDDGKVVYLTQYLNPLHSGAEIWRNSIRNLHDPARFEIYLDKLKLFDLSFPGGSARFRFNGEGVASTGEKQSEALLEAMAKKCEAGIPVNHCFECAACEATIHCAFHKECRCEKRK